MQYTVLQILNLYQLMFKTCFYFNNIKNYSEMQGCLRHFKDIT